MEDDEIELFGCAYFSFTLGSRLGTIEASSCSRSSRQLRCFPSSHARRGPPGVPSVFREASPWHPRSTALLTGCTRCASAQKWVSAFIKTCSIVYAHVASNGPSGDGEHLIFIVLRRDAKG